MLISWPPVDPQLAAHEPTIASAITSTHLSRSTGTSVLPVEVELDGEEDNPRRRRREMRRGCERGEAAAVEVRRVEELAQREPVIRQIRHARSDADRAGAQVERGIDLQRRVGELAERKRAFSDVADAQTCLSHQPLIEEPQASWQGSERRGSGASDDQRRVRAERVGVVEPRIDGGDRSCLVEEPSRRPEGADDADARGTGSGGITALVGIWQQLLIDVRVIADDTAAEVHVAERVPIQKPRLGRAQRHHGSLLLLADVARIERLASQAVARRKGQVVRKRDEGRELRRKQVASRRLAARRLLWQAGRVVGRAVHVQRLAGLVVAVGRAQVDDVVVPDVLPDPAAQSEERKGLELRIEEAGHVDDVGLEHLVDEVRGLRTESETLQVRDRMIVAAVHSELERLISPEQVEMNAVAASRPGSQRRVVLLHRIASLAVNALPSQLWIEQETGEVLDDAEGAVSQERR